MDALADIPSGKLSQNNITGFQIINLLRLLFSDYSRTNFGLGYLSFLTFFKIFIHEYSLFKGGEKHLRNEPKIETSKMK